MITSSNVNIMHCTAVAGLFRQLAEWIDQHGVTPWHIEYDWQNQSLLVHLSASIFFEVFPNAGNVIDYMGTTWFSNEGGLTFQCYLSHESQLDSTDSCTKTKQTFQYKESA